MAAKDRMVVRNTAVDDATSVESTISIGAVPLDVGTAFSRSGDVVTLEEDARVLCLFGGEYEKTGFASGGRAVSISMQEDTGGGFGYLQGSEFTNTITDDNGCDRCAPFGGLVFDGSAGTDYRFRHEVDLGEDADLQADTFGGMFLRLPAGFDVASYRIDGENDVGGAYTNTTLGSQLILDTASFEKDGTDGIKVLAAGPYLLLSSLHYTCESSADGSGSGVIVQLRAQINNTTNLVGGFDRKVIIPGDATESSVSCFVIAPIELAANDVVRIQRRWLNKSTGTDKVDLLEGTRNQFTLIRLDADADRFFVSRTADDIEAEQVGDVSDSPYDVEFDVNDELDTGSFAHSTSTNPGRVTMPSAAVLTGWHLGINGTGSRGANDLHQKAYLRHDVTGTASSAQYGIASGSPNVGDAPGTHHHQTDITAAYLADFSGEVEELWIDNYGTADDTDLTLQGGTGIPDSFWWGINIDQWPDDPSGAAAFMGFCF